MKKGVPLELLFLEATVGFGPAIKVLQTYALPLGYVAMSFASLIILPQSSLKVKHIFNFPANSGDFRRRRGTFPLIGQPVLF